MAGKTLLDKATATIGWMLWAGIYMFWIGLFLVVLEAVSPVEKWRPDTWNMGTWLLAISLTIMGTIGYTLLMLLLVYGVRRLIERWGLKLQPATSKGVKPDANKSN